MKKFMLLALAVGTFSFTSCSSDDDNAGEESNCSAELQENFTTAQAAYSAEQNTANCQAYKAALRAYIDGGCAEAEQEENLESMHGALPCD